mmetsp:Transcript_22024/g.48004  ORF Transcript_22024/g.48004 Transcript_22024/m.48004 type:complete len:1418 (-) Transcript_22024:222-4475(-)
MSSATAAINASEQPEWELRKENAAPLARGRNAATLSQALSSSSQVDDDTRRAHDKRIREFERLVKPSERAAEIVGKRSDDGEPVERDLNPLELLEESELGDNGTDDDPLVHWLSYIKFHQEAYPSDTRTQFLLTERCSRAIVMFPRYRNDVRFIRVCVLYADKTSSPSDIFKFLHKRGVGGKSALFWIAWAWVAEKADDYRFAEKIYVRAITKKAQPTKMLEDRHKQFQRRMSRHWLNTSTLDQASIEEEANGARSSRGALSGLTETGVRRNHRDRGSNRDISFSAGMRQGNNGYGWGDHRRRQQVPSRNSASTRSIRGPESVPNAVMAKAGFSIFVDENDENGGGYDLNRSRDERGSGRRDGGSSSRIATEADRIKENEGRTEKWNERGGLNDDHGEESAEEGGLYVRPQQQQRSAAPTFEVFVDDECAADNKHEEEQLARERQRKKRDEGDGRSLRQRLDGGVADRLQRDPLRYMRNPSKQSVDKAKYGDDVPSSAKKLPKKDEKPPRSDKKSSKSSQKSKATKKDQPSCFDKSLVEKDADGHECCFEEARARARYYTLVTSNNDFNRLTMDQGFEVQKQNDSAMDVDSSSINDTEMEEDGDDDDVEMESAHKSLQNLDDSSHHMHKSSFNSADVNGAGMADSGRKALMPKRVLFGGVDESAVSSEPTPKNLSAVSAASSAVDERYATGAVGVGKRDETTNAHIAKMSVSMMFASPADGVDGSDADADVLCALAEHGDISEAYPSASKPLFSNHTAKKVRGILTPSNEGIASSLDETDHGDTASFSAVADLINGHAEVENKEPKLPQGGISSGTQEADTEGGFKMFRDSNKEGSMVSESGGDLATATTVAGGSFAIFRDPTVGHDAGAMKNNYDSSDEDDDSSCGDRDDGNTATLGEIGDAFKDLVAAAGEDTFKPKPKAKSTHSNQSVSTIQEPATALSIFCDDEHDDANGKKISPCEHILNDGDTRDGFGAVDISRIAPASPDNMTNGDTIHTVLLPETAIDYISTHQRDIKTAMRSIFTDGSASVIDYRSQDIPRGFQGTKPVKGAEIDLDNVTAVVQHELGRGGNGIVLLAFAKNDAESFSAFEDDCSAVALKVQTPTGCLAWERRVLFLVEQRMPVRDNLDTDTKQRGSRKRRSSASSHGSRNRSMFTPAFPFPKPFSFVAFNNGGLLGMTAASSNGLNIVDLVNRYKKSGEGSVPELIAIHYTVRMLKHLETLHWDCKVLHVDVKPDNWVLVASSTACDTGRGSVVPGSDLMLVDFGRAVDLKAAANSSSNYGDPLEVRFRGNAAAKDMECVAMREGLSWGLDVDTYGLCASAYTLLYGEHMDIVKDKSSKRWRPHKPLRRYWNKDLWFGLFDTLINIGGGSDGSYLGSHPNSLRAIRKSFEGYLDEGNRRLHVESLLKQQQKFLTRNK